LIEIINKQLLLQLVGYLCYWQMGFNSVFKGLKGFYVRLWVGFIVFKIGISRRLFVWAHNRNLDFHNR